MIGDFRRGAIELGIATARERREGRQCQELINRQLFQAVRVHLERAQTPQLTDLARQRGQRIFAGVERLEVGELPE